MSTIVYDYQVEIGLPFGELTPVVNWCERNCKAEWTAGFHNAVASNGNLYTFQFSSEEDYVNFLIWKK